MGGEVQPFDQASDYKGTAEPGRWRGKAKEERCRVGRPARWKRRILGWGAVVVQRGAGLTWSPVIPIASEERAALTPEQLQSTLPDAISRGGWRARNSKLDRNPGPERERNPSGIPDLH